jgi:hypothetical protein
MTKGKAYHYQAGNVVAVFKTRGTVSATRPIQPAQQHLLK